MFDGEDKCLIVDQSQEPDAICDCNPSFSPANNNRQLAVCQANARLIAAAPDLLAELNYIDSAAPSDLAESHDDELVTIVVTAKAVRDFRAAIAKATPLQHSPTPSGAYLTTVATSKEPDPDVQA